MKKGILHRLLVGMLMVVLAASCSGDAGDPVQTSGQEKVQVCFTIAMNDAPQSRSGEWDDNWDADPDYDDEAGTTIDNAINNLCVVLFSTDNNTCYGEVQNPIYFKEGTEGNVYTFMGDISINSSAISDGKLVCKVMVLANAGTGTIGSISDLGNLTFTHNGNPAEIPMWGVKTITADDNVTVTAGSRSDLGTIYLLRAMAKIEVIMADEKHTMQSVTLTRRNSIGYTAPYNYSNVTATELLNREAMRIPATTVGNNVVTTGTSLNAVTTGTKYTLYVPEYDNCSTNATPATLTVRVNGKDYTIFFKDYLTNDGEIPDYDIVRNHIYRFTITEVKEDQDVELTLTVSPWNLKTMTVDYKTEGAAKQQIAWENNAANANDEVLLSASTPSATFSFELSAPTGGTWYATLITREGDANAFSFADGGVVTTVSGEVGTAASLTVYATETTNIAQNNVARLAITVKIGERIIDVTDLLGEYKIMQAKTTTN